MPTYLAFGKDQLHRIARLIESLADDRAWCVTVSDRHGKRSSEQNARFHKVIDLIALETGNSPAAVKEAVKAEFGPRIEIDLGDHHHTVPKPSSSYTEEEMSLVLDRMEAWAASDLGMLL